MEREKFLIPGDEDEHWAKKAIDNLMKKLHKHNKEALVKLEEALKVRQYLRRTDTLPLFPSLCSFASYDSSEQLGNQIRSIPFFFRAKEPSPVSA